MIELHETTLIDAPLDRCFDLERALAHAGGIVDRAIQAP